MIISSSQLQWHHSPFGSNSIRSFIREGIPYFIGDEICHHLGFNDATSAMNSFCCKQKEMASIEGWSSQNEELRVLRQADVLRLICHSPLKTAALFESWFFGTLLPHIAETRGQGASYISKGEVRTWQNWFGSSVRSIVIDAQAYFVGNDVCAALGYQNAQEAMERYCLYSDVHHCIRTEDGLQNLRLILEPDIYHLAAHSKVTAAFKYERWIYQEVIPIINREEIFSLARIDYQHLEFALKSALGEILMSDTKRMGMMRAPSPSPSMETRLKLYAMSDLSTDLYQAGMEFSPADILKWLKDTAYLSMENVPTQISMALGLFSTAQCEAADNCPMLTRAGREYFLRLLLDRKETCTHGNA